ncbi:MAG: TIGR00159 family protein [Oscillospiraceae bacterium]|jgi:diadenylate cyclase|nr:TIGR00159 family protein [Oscillospiraceae bacterium]MCI8757453.1 TIGR00159 family protein [Oscillospiraceae bacterium]
MEVLTNVIERASSFVLSLELWDLLDILVIAYLVYRLLLLVRRTNTSRLLKGVLVVIIALWLSAGRLRALNFLLNYIVEWGVVALLVLFQPEIRRVLEQVGSSSLPFLQFFSKPRVDRQTIEQAISQTVSACGDMSKSRTGALIVFERHNQLDEMLRSGTKLDAEVSSELLKNIFFVKAPMHDGAVIVREGRVLGAGCMLPLSRNVNLSRDLGMRHRAGIGMSENSDAVVVLVSEETGSISVAVGGMLKRHLMTETLEQLLRNELLPQPEEDEGEKRTGLKALLGKEKKDGGKADE